MQSSLEIKRFLRSGVLYVHVGLELIAAQFNGESASELLVPNFLGVIGGQHLEFNSSGSGRNNVPVDIAGKTMLLNLSGSKLKIKIRKQSVSKEC
jgi:hypothetical protein